jgi:hypothetical protein
MNAGKRETARVCLGCAAALWGGQSSATDATVQWHGVTDDFPPPAFALNPANPTTTNATSFVAPTDGKIYVNFCFASASCGNPALTVDSTNQTITVSFSAPPTNSACPEIFLPVSGVEGQFGPLSAGTWVFKILQNSYPFSVTEAALRLSIKALTNAFTFQLCWPVSGEPFALEFNEGLFSGNWQAVTNPPTTSSNRNTVQIYGASGSRFFRLRRLHP